MRLAINIDHEATLREARADCPTRSPQHKFVSWPEQTGSSAIFEDRRHINDRDLRLLRKR
jgi:pyridoxine 5'-phosphate synthase PdxJ